LFKIKINEMTQKIHIDGMTCGGCENSVLRIASDIKGFISGKADRTTSTLEFESSEKISLQTIKDTFSAFPKYTILGEKIETSVPSFDLAVYRPLLLILFYIVIVSVFASFPHGDFSLGLWSAKKFLHHFMTGFFLVFSFFKLLDVKSFSMSFRNYDIIASKVPFYGTLYPYLELGLAIACLLTFDNPAVYIFDIVLMFTGLIGVVKSNLAKKEIQCACLGTVFNLPMSKITIFENTIMIMVGILLLVL
jgi:copper chaperone CopZ